MLQGPEQPIERGCTVTETSLSALSTESRRFDPPAELAAHANVTADSYAHAAKDRLGFWEQLLGCS